MISADQGGAMRSEMIETQIRPDGKLELRPFGDLDWTGSLALRHLVHDAFYPGIDVVIDLRRVAHVDAVGLSAIAGVIRRVQAVGGEVDLCHPRPSVRRRLELAGIYHLSLLRPVRTGNDAA
jgi:anti-anti-sigma factor